MNPHRQPVKEAYHPSLQMRPRVWEAGNMAEMGARAGAASGTQGHRSATCGLRPSHGPAWQTLYADSESSS